MQQMRSDMQQMGLLVNALRAEFLVGAAEGIRTAVCNTAQQVAEANDKIKNLEAPQVGVHVGIQTKTHGAVGGRLQHKDAERDTCPLHGVEKEVLEVSLFSSSRS